MSESSYLITGCTGLIGKRIVERLIDRPNRVDLLVRPGSIEKRRPLLESWERAAAKSGASLRILVGDVTQPDCGIGDGVEGQWDHVFHFAADYDLRSDAATNREINVEGTQRLVERLRARGFKGIFHHASSIAVAGDYQGLFTEAMLDEGQGHPHPYLQSKFESEVFVREIEDLRWRIYRPGAVVGDSKSGEMDKLDGPYFLFKLIQKTRSVLPNWVPLAAPNGEGLNVAPVDYVADAIVHIAHKEGEDGKTFHIIDPKPPRFAEGLDIFMKAAHGPRIRWKIRPGSLGPLQGFVDLLANTASVRFYRDRIATWLGIPPKAAEAMNSKVRYDAANLNAALEGSGIRCPRLADYAPKIWNYYELYLDPDRDMPKRRREALEGKLILITGASSGVGEATAIECAKYGAHPILVARRKEELERVGKIIEKEGGACTLIPADLSDMEECDRVVKETLDRHGYIDILLNNAAKSIRRPLTEQVERFHDFERVMQLNFFAAVRLTLGFLPSMRERKSGHVLNNLTWGVLFRGPRYAAYLSSKCALDGFSDVFAGEFAHENILSTSVYLPWVRTPMIGPSDEVKDQKMLTPTEAAYWVIDAIVYRKRRVIHGFGLFTGVANLVDSRGSTMMINLLYRLFPGQPGEHGEFATERKILRRWIKASPL